MSKQKLTALGEGSKPVLRSEEGLRTKISNKPESNFKMEGIQDLDNPEN
jgi:hypothetical protein